MASHILLLLGGDIERNPGPAVGRGPLDLSVGFAAATSDRMRKCLSGFQLWCRDEASIDWSQLATDPQAVALALRGYGLHLFERGHPRYLYTYAITATQEHLPAVRPFLSVAWHINKKWQIHEPGQCRSVLPAVVLQAICCIAGLWRWNMFLGLTLLGFGAMLHPSEMLALQRKDLIFPRDVHGTSRCLYVRVRDPKTAPQGCCVVLEQRTFTISLKRSIGLLGGGDGREFEHWSTTCKRWVPRFSSMSSSLVPELASRFWLMHLVPFSGVFSLRSRRLGVECNSWLTVFQMHQCIGKWPSILFGFEAFC